MGTRKTFIEDLVAIHNCLELRRLELQLQSTVAIWIDITVVGIIFNIWVTDLKRLRITG